MCLRGELDVSNEVCVFVGGLLYLLLGGKKAKNVMPVNKHAHSYLLLYQNILLHEESDLSSCALEIQRLSECHEMYPLTWILLQSLPYEDFCGVSL